MGIKRTTTTTTKIFNRSGPEAVTYGLSQAHRVTITVPPGSQWTSGPHWHEKHTEYLQIQRGRALVTLGSVTKEYTAQDGIIAVPKYAVHEWRRVPGSKQENNRDQDGDDLVVHEWTVPADGDKEAFFRMLNSFLTEEDPSRLYELPWPIRGWPLVGAWVEKWVVILQLFTIFWTWDNYPVFVRGGDSGWISWTVTHLILRIASWVARWVGVYGSYPEYLEGLRTGDRTPLGKDKDKDK